MRKILFTMFLVLCCLLFVFFLYRFHTLPTRRTTQNSSPSQSITIIAVGDIMLGRSVNAKMRSLNDFTYPFQKTADILRSADLVFGNLESPFWSDCPTTNTGMIFCADPKAIQGLTFAGFDILSIANNHILNYGKEGKDFTINLLQQNNIISSADNFAGQAIGFLSYDLTTSVPSSLISQISKISPTVDILIVSLHWGTEYDKKPQAWQTELAHQIINSGAKVVIGHHPHVTQPTEEYKGGLIFYSLGNFVFDQPWSEETKKGNIAKIIFEGKEIKSWEEIPVYMQNLGQPKIID